MTEARTFLPLFAISLSLVLAGCSALVNPDDGRLGGDPGADSSTGDGGGTDTGTVDGGTDSGADSTTDSSADAGDTGTPCPGGCDDGVDCTVDECVAGACQNDPRDALCGDDEVCDVALDCATATCENDGECDDSLYCNGEEHCDVGAPGANERGCVAGEAIECDDAVPCTIDACDEDADRCSATPDDSVCADTFDCTVDSCAPAADGADSDGCAFMPDDTACDAIDFCTVGQECVPARGGCVGGRERDCRDGDACTDDACDSAAGMCISTGRDDDGDGYPTDSFGGAACTGGTDCDDDDPSVNPGATELCNGRDDNCNGGIDEACVPIPDTCRSAVGLTLATDGSTTTVTGRLGDFDNDYRSGCGNSGGRDAVYYVDVTSTVDIEIDTIGSVADTVLAVATECSNTGFNALGCDDDFDNSISRASRLWVHPFGPTAGGAARRLFILVDGYNGSASGDFTLNIRATPAAADSCLGPIDISPGGSLIGFASPPTIGVIGPRGSCQGSGTFGEHEAIARVEGPSDGSMRFDVYSRNFDPDLYLRSRFCAAGTEVACVAGDGVGSAGFPYHTALEATTTSGRNYFLFVDGMNSAASYWVSYTP